MKSLRQPSQNGFSGFVRVGPTMTSTAPHQPHFVQRKLRFSDYGPDAFFAALAESRTSVQRPPMHFSRQKSFFVCLYAESSLSNTYEKTMGVKK